MYRLFLAAQSIFDYTPSDIATGRAIANGSNLGRTGPMLFSVFELYDLFSLLEKVAVVFGLGYIIVALATMHFITEPNSRAEKKKRMWHVGKIMIFIFLLIKILDVAYYLFTSIFA